MDWSEQGDVSSDLPISIVPVLGRIAVGVPLLTVEQLEDYEPAPVFNPENYFYLIVKGDSMINAGIKDGYRVLVKKQPVGITVKWLFAGLMVMTPR